MTNACNDKAYLNAIALQKRFKLTYTPPPRYNNLSESPYPQFSESQLNMRRKVQILEYNASTTNTKTNNLTRSERWAQLVAGKTQQRNLPYSYINNNLIDKTTNFVQTCPSGTILYTPTYASGIPGPIMNLYYDPSVPLYMYKTNANNPAIVNQPDNTSQFIYDNNLSSKDQYLDQSNNVVVSSIYIYNILTSTYSFNIDFPVSFFIKGKVKPNKTGIYKEQINLNFNSNLEISRPSPFQPYIYYGDSKVDNKVFDLPCQTYSPELQSVIFDISMNVNSLNSDTNQFFGNQYVGNYKIFKLILETQKGYVYDICLNSVDLNGNRLLNYVFLNQNTKFYDYFENLSYGICVNVAYETANTFINCLASDAVDSNGNNIKPLDKTKYRNNFNLTIR